MTLNLYLKPKVTCENRKVADDERRTSGSENFQRSNHYTVMQSAVNERNAIVRLACELFAQQCYTVQLHVPTTARWYR
jgi:hypothetical protein